MGHDVFISHSSKDKPIADAICANLEAAGVRCWIAPRDITPSEKWPAAISKAIAKSHIMVLVFSSNSNVSEPISHELSLAAKNKVIIVPIRIEKDLEPEAGIDFFLEDTHWMDVMNPPTQEQIDIFVTLIKLILSGVVPPEPEVDEPIQVIPIVTPSPTGSSNPKPVRQIPVWAWGILIIFILLVGGAASVYLREQTSKTVPLASPVPSLTNAPEISATQASGPQSEQARTFAEPILTAIAHRKPDFEDDFSKVNPDWFINGSGQGTSAIEDGVARLQTSNGDVGMFDDTALTGKDFVLQLDSRLVSGDTTSEISVGLHNASETHKFWLFLHPAVKAWETGGVWGSNFFGVLTSGEDAVSPVGKITHITIITRGTRFGLYLNQIPTGFFDNSDFDNAGKTQFRFTSSSPAVCEFDNVKFWNLANIPGLP